MTRTKSLLLVGVIAVSTLLSGCGEKMLTITEEESDIIASYSAKLISKFNLHQKTGYCNAYTTAADLGIVATPRPEDQVPDDIIVLDGTDEITSVPSETPADVIEDVQITPSTKPARDDLNTPESGSDLVEGFTLGEAIGIAGLDFEVTELSITNQFVASSYFVLTAASGCDYVVLNIVGKNNASTAVNLDMPAMGDKYKLYVNGKFSAVNQSTILLNDLSTYKGSIGAGEKKNFVLVFQFKSEQLENLEKVDLRVAGESGDRSVALE